MQEDDRALDCVFFTVIIDDIVMPDGRTSMGQLGGGGPQCICGYQAAAAAMQASSATPSSAHVCPRLGLFAGVGADIPAAALEWLKAQNVELSGLQYADGSASAGAAVPTARAWQLFEEDGLRTQVWRSRYSDPRYPEQLLRPPFESMPAALRHANAYHVGLNPASFDLELLEQLRERTTCSPDAGTHLAHS
jgi:hypothetical protein